MLTVIALVVAAAPTAAGAGVATGSSLSSSQVSKSFAALDKLVKADMQKTGVPGVAVAIVSGDRVVYTKGYGVRSTKTDKPVTAQTVFQIASLSKPISSTIMAGLVGKGTFAWTDPVKQYVPNDPLSDPWVTDHVTFADLFAHRSGLPGAAGNDLEGIGFDRTTILERLRYVPLNPFRITYSYSNFAMTLGGEAAAVAAGSSWSDVSDKVLFGPAGMTSTSMDNADYLAQKNRADLHVKIDGKWTPDFSRDPDAQAPAGGISSNVVDLGQWMRIQLNEGKLGKKQLIDQEALDATHTPQVMNRPLDPVTSPASFYGLGWSITTGADGLVSWDHSGAFSNGAATAVKLIPAKKIGIVVLTNGSPIGLPEAIAADYLTDLTTGSSNTNTLATWTKRFLGVYGPKPDLTKPANPTAGTRRVRLRRHLSQRLRRRHEDRVRQREAATRRRAQEHDVRPRTLRRRHLPLRERARDARLPVQGHLRDRHGRYGHRAHGLDVRGRRPGHAHARIADAGLDPPQDMR